MTSTVSSDEIPVALTVELDRVAKLKKQARTYRDYHVLRMMNGLRTQSRIQLLTEVC